MEYTKKIEQAQEVMNNIASKCWEDESFKQELIASPVETLERFTGQPVELAEGTTLIVNDQTDPNYMYFNIPPKPNLDDLELSDEELETVAGGDMFTGFCIGVAIVGAIYTIAKRSQ